jgi:hypothetical protein
MFQRVPYTNLVVGKKYRINGHFSVYTGIYKGLGQDDYFNIMFSIVKNNRKHDTILFTKHELFYEFVSNNPQSKMERRSVNIIVRQLIGDVHFTW